jgi:hypothetical protein
VPRPVWIALALLAAGLYYGHTRYEAGQVDERATQAKAQAIAVAAVRKQTRDLEAEDRRKFADIDAQAHKEKDHALVETQRVADCYRSGKCRVHARFQCPARPGVLPEAAATAEGGDGEVQAGLLGEDAGFLVGEAGRANRAVIALNACQATLDAERR